VRHPGTQFFGGKNLKKNPHTQDYTVLAKTHTGPDLKEKSKPLNNR